MRRGFFFMIPAVVSGATGPGGVGKSVPRTGPADIRISIVSALVLIVLLSGVSIRAQSVTRLRGAVYDRDDGNPVAMAGVSLASTSYRTVTDKNGRFHFDNIPSGWYTLIIRAFGYDSSVVEGVQLSGDISTWRTVLLGKHVYELPGMTVRVSPLPVSSGDVQVIEREEITARNPVDLADLLTTVPGVNIQRSGTAGSPARVAMRGSSSRHVLVLVDGHQINSSATGEADINSVPVDMIDCIEVYKGGNSAAFGPNALGGVINIITQPRRQGHERSCEIKNDRGAWGSAGYTFSAVNVVPVDSLSTSLNFNREKTNGDFDYRYTVQPQGFVYEGTRNNNDATSDNWHLAAAYRPARRTELSFSGQVYDSERGLPGKASDPNRNARADDDRVLLSAEYKQHFCERFRTDCSLGYSRYVQTFLDTLNTIAVDRFNSKYVNNIFSARVDAQWFPWEGHTADFGFCWQDERLDHEDRLRVDRSMGRTVRTDAAVFASLVQHLALPSWLLFDRFTAESSLRWDHVRTGRDTATSIDYFAPVVGGSFAVGDSLKLVCRGRYGKSLSLPNLNALFWQGDALSKGNPDLKPEKAEHSEGGLELTARRGRFSLNVGGTYFHTFYYDLVQWQPGRGGVWQPFNLAGAQVTGHEDFVEIGLFDRMIELSYQNTITTAINREPGINSYGNQLTYTPHYQTGVSIRLNHKLVFASYDIRWVGKRFAKENNQKWYEAYRLDDLRLGGRFPVGRWRLQLEYRAYNLRDEQYTLISHYPMPPREWHVEASLSYNFSPGEN